MFCPAFLFEQYVEKKPGFPKNIHQCIYINLPNCDITDFEFQVMGKGELAFNTVYFCEEIIYLFESRVLQLARV